MSPHTQTSMTDLQMKVLCILNHEDEYPTDALLHIKDHCDLLNIPFYTRAYDSIKFSEDRKYIQKLPAFHIFVKGLHKDTFYTDSSPKLKIRSIYDKYKAKAKAKEKAKANTWNIFRLFSSFPSFTRKNPLRVTDWK
jgi:hypothetical protein